MSLNVDIESSSDEYATRFSGPVGRWMLEVQNEGVKKLLGQKLPSKVLEVGGGHGQLTPLLVDLGCHVTILASDPVCEKRVAHLTSQDRCKFVVGDLMDPPFEPESFDTVISIRMLAHCPNWEDFIRGLCRVARSRVIVDYPSWQSFNILYGGLFSLKKGLERNTRTFSTFWDSDIHAAFLRNSASLEAKFPQFFLPMVLHRALKSGGISKFSEDCFRILGLTGIFGSPTLACYSKVT